MKKITSIFVRFFGVMLFLSSCFASTHDKIETHFKIINLSKHTLPIKIKTYGDTELINSPISLTSGENLFNSLASPAVDLRFYLEIGDEQNKAGQCRIASYTLFGEELRDGNGSSGFKCSMVSTTHDQKPYLEIRNS